MSEPILVTGATGTVGREVVKGLLGRGICVRVAARSKRAFEELGPVDCRVFDFHCAQSARNIWEGIRRVFLLTPLEESMAEVASQLIEHAKAAGVQHVVRLSAMGADGSQDTELGRVHRAVEQAIEAAGLSFTFLRPNAFMQNYLTAFGASIRAEGLFALPQGAGRVSLVDARDVAAVAVAALTEAGHQAKAYDLTGPEALSNWQVAQLLSEATQRPIRYRDVSESKARNALLGQGVSPWLVRVFLELYAVSRAGDAARVSPAVREVLDRPPIGFRQFAGDYAEHFC